jgi:hypothetical protein
MNRIYRVLNEIIPADDVVAMLGAADSPWIGRQLEVQMREVNPVLRSALFKTAGSSTTVSLVGDDTAQTLYLAIEGAAAAEVHALAQVAEVCLPVASFDELLSEATDRYRAEPYRLIRLALGTTAIANPEALALFESTAADSNPAVRKAAINALSLTQWAAALGPLQDREANDPEPELRDFARRAIYSLRLALGMEQ